MMSSCQLVPVTVVAYVGDEDIHTLDAHTGTRNRQQQQHIFVTKNCMRFGCSSGKSLITQGFIGRVTFTSACDM